MLEASVVSKRTSASEKPFSCSKFSTMMMPIASSRARMGTAAMDLDISVPGTTGMPFWTIQALASVLTTTGARVVNTIWVRPLGVTEATSSLWPCSYSYT